MKALGGSYLKFFACKQRENDRVLWCSRESAFLGHQKRVGDGFSLTVSSKHKYGSSVSVSASASAPAQTNVGSEEIQTICSNDLKMARVRFKLSQECAFGQHFFIVGDDEILGLWDPSEGVPLTWSEGHVWTAEIDLPTGKVIKYKFILKGEDESLSWQPGPDRTVETWETEKTITVLEDWDNHELQNIVEEEDVISDLNEESLIDSGFSVEDLKEPESDQKEKPFASMVAENIATEEFGGVDMSLRDKGSDVMTVTEQNDEGKGDLVINGSNPLTVTDQNKKPFASMVAENIATEEFWGQDLSLSDKGSDGMIVTEKNDEGKGDLVINGSNPVIPEHEMKDEGVPVLVPGLIPMPHEDETEETEVDEVEEESVENTKSVFDEIEDISTELELEPEPEPELKGEESVSTSQHYTETMMMADEKVQQQRHGKEQQIEHNVLESDVQWGRRTIKKFLADLGFI